ncbi:MAG: hypothetical protein E7632_07265 [Ruminococcaceae bacterium]|nr:hypothetical protein [Oscillospiraceae bacterium]
MRVNNKRAISLMLLAALMAAVGCGTQPSDAPVTSDDTTSDVTTDIYAGIPTGDFGGETFSILNSNYDWALFQMDAESQNGEILNDAVFERNVAVEERLNIKLEIDESGYYENTADTLNTLILAQDDVWDAAYVPVMHAAPSAAEGYYLNLYDIDALNFEEAWWNQRSIPYYELNGKLFWAHGDAQINYFDCLWVLMFNQKLIDDLQMENPYDLVASGKWTLDKFEKMVTDASMDLNSDSIYNEEDRMGLATHSGSAFGFLHGVGETAIGVVDGVPTISPLTERMIGAVEKLQGILTSKYVRMKADTVKTEMFASDKLLFLGETLGNASALREMIADFGILPFPKYDEAQTSYGSYMSPAALGMFIPVTVSDQERSGIVMECMNALSHETVRPAYYDIVLGEKNLRDEASRSTLDTLFESAECELAYVYGWGNYRQTMASVITSDSPIASKLESVREATQTAMDVFMANMK